MSDAELEELPDRQSLMLFGYNYAKIECFRKSMLNGFATAFAGGVATFFYTSKVKTTIHGTFASFWIGAWATWIYCRYNKYKREKFWDEIKKDQRSGQLVVDNYVIPRASTYKRAENEVENHSTKSEK